MVTVQKNRPETVSNSDYFKGNLISRFVWNALIWHPISNSLKTNKQTSNVLFRPCRRICGLNTACGQSVGNPAGVRVDDLWLQIYCLQNQLWCLDPVPDGDSESLVIGWSISFLLEAVVQKEGWISPRVGEAKDSTSICHMVGITLCLGPGTLNPKHGSARNTCPDMVTSPLFSDAQLRSL